MNITYTKVIPKSLPKNQYVLTVHTMEGDGDDYHEFKISFENTAEGLEFLQRHLKCLDELDETDSEGYDEIPDFKFFQGCQWYSNEYGYDALDGYDLHYYNENSELFICEVTL